MSWPAPVASFWSGGDLSFVEQMVIRSYLDLGADFTLYVDGPVGGIPDGARIYPAGQIMPRPGFVRDEAKRKQLAVWSDLFRLHLLRARPGVIWVDLDAYCLRPFPPGPHLFGQAAPGNILSGVLALPPESPALSWMLAFLAPGSPLDPVWRDAETRARITARPRRNPLNLPWGDTGPRLLSHALTLTGEDRHALPPAAFYPLFRATLPKLWRAGLPDESIAGPDSLSVHIFGYTKRVLTTYWRGLPPPDSWLARAAARHGIDPAAAPAFAEALPASPIAPRAQGG